MISFSQWEQAEKLSAGSQPPVINQESRSTLFYSGIHADCAFYCSGHSMEPTFLPGELVFIHKQETFTDGQIVAVQIGSGMTLKRLYKLSNGFRLVPDNRLFDPVEITGKQAENVKVYGIAIARK